MSKQLAAIALRVAIAGVVGASLLSCSQQSPDREPQGASSTGTVQPSRSGNPGMSGDMQQMMARCDQMMREGHGGQMTPEMQKMMDDCQRMMQQHGSQPMR